jgi:RNA polymerase sigma-B factor
MTVQPDVDVSRSTRHRTTNDLLARAAATDDRRTRDDAIEEAVLLTMPVARSVAARYRDKGVPTEDLEQVAYMALLRAARHYDPDQADDFLSYAVPSMRGELKKYFRDHAWAVRPPRRVQEIQTRVLSTRRTLEHERGAGPTTAEIAAELGEDERDVEESLRAQGCFNPTSLDQPLGPGGGTFVEQVYDDGAARDRERVEARATLFPVLRRLRPRDRRILQLRFCDECTQQEIADELGVTQMQVSRLISRILRDVRTQLDPGSAVPARAG